MFLFVLRIMFGRRFLTQTELLQELEKGLPDIKSLNSDASDYNKYLNPKEIGRDSPPDKMVYNSDENEQPGDYPNIEEIMVDEEHLMPNFKEIFLYPKKVKSNGCKSLFLNN